MEGPEVTILIGTDGSNWKLEERRGRESYAIRTPLGWSVAGPMKRITRNEISSFCVWTGDKYKIKKVDQMFNFHFSQSLYDEEQAMSQEDIKSYQMMVNSVKVVKNHYQLDLTFRERTPFLDNRPMVKRRMTSLKLCFRKDKGLHKKYTSGISKNIIKGYAAKVPATVKGYTSIGVNRCCSCCQTTSKNPRRARHRYS